MGALAKQDVVRRAAAAEAAAPTTHEQRSPSHGMLDKLDMEDLRDLMRSVDETAGRLEQTHAALAQEVARLQGELAEANAQLRRTRSLAALGEMAAGIAHEIRNPLGSIRLYVQMLVEDLSDLPAASGRPLPIELCEKIERAIDGLEAIVRDVLLFAREARIHTEPTRARDLLDGASSACEALCAGVEVVVDAGQSDLRLEADSSLVEQALSNVVRNAVEAMVEAGTPRPRLALRAQQRAERCPDGARRERIVLAVEDHGPGIPDEVVPRMFNPFFTTRRSGTGLGLAIVHRIVDAHGGHINVRRAPGGGALVELCLPPAPERAAGAAATVGCMTETAEFTSSREVP